MAEMKIFKRTALPTTFVPNAQYIILPPGSTTAQIWFSSADGLSVYRVGAEEDLDQFLLMGMNNA